MAADRVQQLLRRSDLKGLHQLGLHFALISVTGLLVWQLSASIWLWPAMLVHGVGLVFLFAPLHETIHRTAFRSRWLNDTVAWGAGLLLMLGPGFFRAFHFAHHRHTQDPARDPELMGASITTPGRYIVYLSGLNYWRFAILSLINTACARFDNAHFVTQRQRPGIVLESRLFLAVYALVGIIILNGHLAPLTLWLGPVVLAQPLLRAWLLAEHTGCEFTGNMYRNTRTTLTHPGVRLLQWNMGYHVEHHAYPGVPFHALPALHRLISDQIVYKGNGYGRFHRHRLQTMIKT